ncbi:MAG: hypothetical protein JO310_16710 [Hyphomicrobiales bacterium]|nr:hypothetical protein [Hyphomicrobiales bacterium]
MEDYKRYLDDIVQPTIEDFERHPASIRHAFIACVVTVHAVDYLAHPRRPAGISGEYKRLSPDFSLVYEVAHAFKHVATGPRDAPNLTAMEVVRRPPAMAGVMVTGISILGDPTGAVTLADDTNIDLLRVVQRAVAFLREQVK